MIVPVALYKSPGVLKVFSTLRATRLLTSVIGLALDSRPDATADSAMGRVSHDRAILDKHTAVEGGGNSASNRDGKIAGDRTVADGQTNRGRAGGINRFRRRWRKPLLPETVLFSTTMLAFQECRHR